ncbi:PQQ-dependent sugar dehydrogenase [Psychrobium sp. 1_MG-2023]|uniref:PQQ-dependent sugar dehydrogenase n=1 Tax=Psychrobium sp. 1_MG-2023 TaxID=3062624 RepID=UPI000C333923|nr:PQQ-dependent sugar dehydrogenase [Psychrobium sp. 1_MG-2023]MDP2560800.1 PQQ-dependent sugar dehydrogenase [Psychrobium sp. 1_MG-2023]PKF56677.1 dehydrogenase [Alteromonadales bacterium alter-6D02]
MKLSHIILWLIASQVLTSLSLSAEPKDQIKTDVITDVNAIPWGMVLLNERQLLVTLRQGNAVIVNVNTGVQQPVTGLPEVMARGQGGLLDVKLSPDYQQSGWLYFTYSKPVNNQGATTLARAKLTGSALSQWQDILVTQSRSDTSRHYGSRITFDNKGHVFFSVGDRGVRPNGQDLMTHAGSILRLTLDGSVPQDNPFIGREDVLPEIYSYGHRNPQGLAFDVNTNRLWAIEHGPRGGDEINLINPGKNYGWPVTSHGKEYWGPLRVGESKVRTGIETPLKVYSPSIAPSSLLLYQGEEFKQWQGDLFAGALKLTHLNHIKIKNGRISKERRYLLAQEQRIRNVISDPRGRLIIATDDGEIIRLSAK